MCDRALFCKPVDLIVAQSAVEKATDDEPVLERTVGTKELVLFGFGRMIGGGAFVTLGVVASTQTGPSVIVALLLAALGALLTGLCVTELSSCLPLCGASFTYVYATLGELPAFLAGWSVLLGYLLSIAQTAQLWRWFLGALGVQLAPRLSIPLAASGGTTFDLVPFLVVLAVTALIALNNKFALKLSGALVVFMFSVLLIFVFAGFTFTQLANYTPFVLDAQGIAGTFNGIGPLFILFLGFEAIPHMSQDARLPARDIPYALMATLILGSLLFVLLAIILVGVVKTGNISQTAPLAQAMLDQGNMKWLGVMLHMAAMAALTSVIETTIITVARLVYAMSVDGLVPRALGAISSETRTPRTAVVTIGVIGAIIAGIVPPQGELVAGSVLFALVPVCAAIVTLRRTHPLDKLPRVFLCPYVPAVPVLAGVITFAQFAIVIIAKLNAALVFVGWIVAGVLVYTCYGCAHGVGAQSESPNFAARYMPLTASDYERGIGNASPDAARQQSERRAEPIDASYTRPSDRNDSRAPSVAPAARSPSDVPAAGRPLPLPLIRVPRGTMSASNSNSSLADSPKGARASRPLANGSDTFTSRRYGSSVNEGDERKINAEARSGGGSPRGASPRRVIDQRYGTENDGDKRVRAPSPRQAVPKGAR